MFFGCLLLLHWYGSDIFYVFSIACISIQILVDDKLRIYFVWIKREQYSIWIVQFTVFFSLSLFFFIICIYFSLFCILYAYLNIYCAYNSHFHMQLPVIYALFLFIIHCLHINHPPVSVNCYSLSVFFLISVIFHIIYYWSINALFQWVIIYDNDFRNFMLINGNIARISMFQFGIFMIMIDNPANIVLICVP